MISINSNLRKKLLAFYFSNPDQEYYLREIARNIGEDASYLSREISKLEKDGLFMSRKKGNQKHYSLDKEYPLYSEVKNIIFKTVGIEGSLKEIVNEFSNIRIAFIYGSFASAEETSGSDVDVMVIGEIDETEFAKKIRELSKKINREINYTYYSSKEWREYLAIENTFTSSVKDAPKIMLKGSEDEL